MAISLRCATDHGFNRPNNSVRNMERLTVKLHCSVREGRAQSQLPRVHANLKRFLPFLAQQLMLNAAASSMRARRLIMLRWLWRARWGPSATRTETSSRGRWVNCLKMFCCFGLKRTAQHHTSSMNSVARKETDTAHGLPFPLNSIPINRDVHVDASMAVWSGTQLRKHINVGAPLC